MENRRFHELLEAHLRASGYTNYEFARITGINRVNIQRYLAGTRLPDPQTFEAVRQELRLGIQEHRELQEAYYRAMDGDDLYFMRCTIRQMLEEAGNICGMEAGFGMTPEPPDQISAPGIRTINGAIAVERYLWAAIWEKECVFLCACGKLYPGQAAASVFSGRPLCHGASAYRPAGEAFQESGGQRRRLS